MARRRGEENEPHHVRAGIQRDVERLARGQAANFDDQGHIGYAFWKPRQGPKGPSRLGPRSTTSRPACLARQPHIRPAAERTGAADPAARPLWRRRADRPVVPAPRAHRPRGGARHAAARTPPPDPPARPPAIAPAMMTTNSGKVKPTEGSVELNGSNETVTG